uniref:Putative secreted protein n=1 Tax=Anopheles triannulatus TaxID=58253 RepID=A0A2M4B7R9_9DIPT
MLIIHYVPMRFHFILLFCYPFVATDVAPQRKHIMPNYHCRGTALSLKRLYARMFVVLLANSRTTVALYRSTLY